jgi:hypothetical protein
MIPSGVRPPNRSGNTLFLVLVLSTIAALALMGYFSVVQQERSRSSKLLQRIRAQSSSERVVSRIVAVVQSRPWSERFFQEQPYVFSSADGPFKEDSPEFSSDTVRYEGICQHTSAQAKRFRIKLRLIYPSGSLTTPDYMYVSSWDLEYSEGILGNLNRCHVLGTAEVDTTQVSAEALDAQLDLIYETARSPAKDRGLTGTSEPAWMGQVRGFEKGAAGVKAGMLAADPLASLDVPAWVEGQSADRLSPLRTDLAQALAGAASSNPATSGTGAPAPSVISAAEASAVAHRRLLAQNTHQTCPATITPHTHYDPATDQIIVEIDEMCTTQLGRTVRWATLDYFDRNGTHIRNDTLNLH